jgi:hypothetical protein
MRYLYAQAFGYLKSVAAQASQQGKSSAAGQAPTFWESIGPPKRFSRRLLAREQNLHQEDCPFVKSQSKRLNSNPMNTRMTLLLRCESALWTEGTPLWEQSLCKSSPLVSFEGARSSSMAALHCECQVRPNTSLNHRTHYGGPPWPGLGYAVHFPNPGQAVPPQRSG